jgi:hypothetical protein
MPKVPTYQMSQGVPRGGIGVMDAINLSTPYANAMSNVGNMLQHRGEQILKDYDTSRALMAFNKLRDSSRNKLQELSEREGADAQGIQAEYDSWHNKEFQKIESNDLSVFSQREMFKRLSDQRKESDLDHLANREARETVALRKSVLEGVIANAEPDIRMYADNDNSYKNIVRQVEGVIDEKNPGMDTTSMKVKVRENLAAARIESLVDTNPELGLAKLEEHRIELGSKYGVLKNKLEHEQKENRITIAYESIKRSTGSNPYAAIKLLDNVEYTSKNKIDAPTAARLRNVFEGEIRWNKFMTDEARREASIGVMTQVNQALASGDIAGAERAYQSATFLNPFDANQIRNVIDARISKYTDSNKYKEIEKGIKEGKITHESQIEIHKSRGLSVQDTALLNQMLKDEKDNPDRAQGINDAMGWFDKEFNTKKDIRFAKMRPQIEAWLRDNVRTNNIKGAQNILNELITYTGTKDDVKYKYYFFGDISTEKPMGKAIEADRSMREGGKPGAPAGGQTPNLKTPESVMSGTVPTAEHIPADVREKIGRILDAAGKAKTERNYIEVYTRNRDKLMGGK